MAWFEGGIVYRIFTPVAGPFCQVKEAETHCPIYFQLKWVLRYETRFLPGAALMLSCSNKTFYTHTLLKGSLALKLVQLFTPTELQLIKCHGNGNKTNKDTSNETSAAIQILLPPVANSHGYKVCTGASLTARSFQVLLRSNRVDALLSRLLPHGQLLFLNHRFAQSLEKEVAAFMSKWKAACSRPAAAWARSLPAERSPDLSFSATAAAAAEGETGGSCCFRLNEAANAQSGKYLPRPLAADCLLCGRLQFNPVCQIEEWKEKWQIQQCIRGGQRSTTRQHQRRLFIWFTTLEMPWCDLDNQARPCFWEFWKCKWVMKCFTAPVRPLNAPFTLEE